MHENFSRAQTLKSSTDRAFGIVIAIFFALVGGWPLIFGGTVRWWAIGICGAFVVCALLFPRVLNPLNKLWTQFGLLLHKVMNPILLGIIFFLVVTPMGVLMRLAGKDPLRLKPQSDTSTYWIERSPPGPDPDTMKNQF